MDTEEPPASAGPAARPITPKMFAAKTNNPNDTFKRIYPST
jgi:hypothetical protein